MARKKTGGIASDAFGLFLDTICNAFGGIIFISLLVCIMLQLSAKAVVAPARPDEDLRTELARLTEEIGDLQLRIRAQRRNIESMKATLPDREVVDRYTRLADEDRRLEVENRRLRDRLRRIEAEVTAAKDRLERLKRANTEQAKEHERLKEAVRRVRAEQGATLRLPRFHRTEKQQVAVLISGGRLAFAQRYDAGGRPGAVNAADVQPLRDAGGKLRGMRPRPGRGVAVSTPEDLRARLGPQFARFTPAPAGGRQQKDCHYFNVVVWPDSFRQFEILRDWLIEKGFGYGLVLVEAGKEVPIGPGLPEEQ